MFTKFSFEKKMIFCKFLDFREKRGSVTKTRIRKGEQAGFVNPSQLMLPMMVMMITMMMMTLPVMENIEELIENSDLRDGSIAHFESADKTTKSTNCGTKVQTQLARKSGKRKSVSKFMHVNT